jgi:hypothetical protein
MGSPFRKRLESRGHCSNSDGCWYLKSLALWENQQSFRFIFFQCLFLLPAEAVTYFTLTPITTGWRKRPSFQPFSRISNYGLIFAGIYLFMMQMHGYSHTTHPDEFGFSADNHAHEHIKMDEARAAKLIQESTHDTLD